MRITVCIALPGQSWESDILFKHQELRAAPGMMLGASCVITCTPEATHPKTWFSILNLGASCYSVPQGNNFTSKSLKGERVDSPISEFIFYSCQEPKYVGVGGELHWSWASNRPCSLSPGNSTCMAIKVPKILERQDFIFWGRWGKGCGTWKGEIKL